MAPLLDPRLQLPRPLERVESLHRDLPQGGVAETFAEVFAQTLDRSSELRVAPEARDQMALAGIELAGDLRRDLNQAIDKLQGMGKNRALIVSETNLFDLDVGRRELLQVRDRSQLRGQVHEGQDAVVLL